MTPGLSTAVRARGEGGGLRDFDLRASSCKKGIGENKGVDGADGRGDAFTGKRMVEKVF